jgi:phosphoesterase RecJ-like protein
MSPEVQKLAPVILAEIQKAGSILLHCHPSPDPDSVGSALAMKLALESMGKKVTLISGDSEIPAAFMHFPGADTIVRKTFFDLNLSEYDLFIIQDSGSIGMVSRIQPISLPLPMRTVVIDHHASNQGYADVNLVDKSYPATAQMLFDLFKAWNVRMTPEIASNLFIGIYTDTGGFKYTNTSARTYQVAGELTKLVPNFPQLISDMENSNTPEFIAYLGLAFSSIRTFHSGRLGLSVISHADLVERKLTEVELPGAVVASFMRSVVDWKISGALTETEPGNIKLNLRSKDGQTYDVSRLAVALGGGGHKAAAGAQLPGMTIEEAVQKVVATAKELYTL